MIVIGIDAAIVKTGIGVVDGDAFVASSLVRGTKASGIALEAKALNARHVARLAAIELPYHGQNADTTIKLSMAVGQWKQALEWEGISVVLYRAGEWQRSVLGVSPRAKRKERKAAAVTWAMRVLGVKVCEDEADALGLAFYAARMAKLRPRAA